jgi:hypothetical protein
LIPNTFTLLPRLVSTNFGTSSYQCSLSNFPLFQCIYYSGAEHKIYHVSFCVFVC